MTDRVIQEADQALETSLLTNRPKRKEQEGKITLMTALLETDRDVNKIVARYNSRQSCQPNKSYIEGPSLTKISKYNYYGRQYRWEEEEREKEVSKPDIVEVSKSEIMMRQPLPEKEDMLTVKNEKDEKDEDDSLFMHREEVAIPSHQYYIMFDQKKEKIKEKFTRSNKLNTTEPFGFQKSKYQFGDKGHTVSSNNSAWLLSRKVVALEKQVNRLRNTSNTGKTKSKDKRVNMRDVDRLIQNLLK